LDRGRAVVRERHLGAEHGENHAEARRRVLVVVDDERPQRRNLALLPRRSGGVDRSLGERQAHDELASPAFALALRIYRAAMHLGEAPREREADAQSALAARALPSLA